MQPHDTTPTKVCTKCGESKPTTEFSKNKAAPDGLQYKCKACNRAYAQANRQRITERERASRAADPEKYRERSRAWREANAEQKRANDHAYYMANREQIIKRVRAYYAANRDDILGYHRAYHIANRDRIIQRVTEWYAVNKDRKLRYDKFRYAKMRPAILTQNRAYRTANSDAISERRRALYAADPTKVTAARQRRRAALANAEGTHTAADIQAQYKRQHGRCYWCGEKVGKSYHVDHVIPLSRGGTNWPDNLVIACPTCNTSKGAKLPHEWEECGRLL